MADREEIQAALLDEIKRLLGQATAGLSDNIRDLAEAWAWLVAPAQPHGSSSKS